MKKSPIIISFVALAILGVAFIIFSREEVVGSPHPIARNAVVIEAPELNFVEWPELRALDEKIHRAHELAKTHDHAAIREMIPALAEAAQRLSKNPAPPLPAADKAWVRRQINGVGKSVRSLQSNDNMPQLFSKENDQRSDLHETLNGLIDHVEVLMGATGAPHDFIVRAEHTHTDHQCGS